MEAELAALRQLAISIATLKRQGPSDQARLQDLALKGQLQLLALKDAHKRKCLQVEDMKEETARAKQSLEASDLALQNLLYEKQYYEKEIFTCCSFKSKVPEEAVDLMPVEQFWASLSDSPEDAQTRAKAKASDHELMKQRLVHENNQRRALVRQLEQLKQTKVSLLNTVGAQERVLKELQAQLKQLETTAKPLQTVLAPTASLRSGISRAADLLPTPLYVIYSQVVAARDALQLGCSASVVGNLDEAEAYSKSETDMQQSQAADGKQAEVDLYKPHPLQVTLEVHREALPSSVLPPSTKTPPPLITATFQYLPALRVVTAHCANPQDSALLKGLFPGDDGSGMPIEALAQLQQGTFRFSRTQPSRPYRWCQHLAGLDFVPTLPTLAGQLSGPEQDSVLAGLDLYRRQQRVVTVVQRLREVKLGDAALTSILGSLLKSPLPSDASMYPRTPSSVVVLWEEITSDSSLEHQASIAETAAATARAGSIGVDRQRGVSEGAAAAPSRAVPAAQQQQQQQQQQGGAEIDEEGQLDDGELPQQQGEGQTQGAGEAAGVQGGAGDRPQPMEEDAEAGELPAEEEGQDGSADGGSAADGVQQDAERGIAKRRHSSARGAAAMQLLLQEEEEAAAAAAPVVQEVPKPPSRLFRCLLRSKSLEAEVHVRLYTEYPLRPPLLLVKALREMPPATAAATAAAVAKGGGSSLKAAAALPGGAELEGSAVNGIAWMEQQANVDALAAVPKAKARETLLYQMTHLRLGLDEVTNSRMTEQAAASKSGATAGTAALTATASGSADDVMAGLAAKQRLRGRDRHPALPIAVL